MLKKFLTIFFCIAFSVNDYGQHIPAERLIMNIRNIASGIMEDSTISGYCKKNIKVFTRTIPQNKIVVTNELIQKLLKNTDRLNASFNASYKEKCESKILYDLLDSTTQLAVELKKLYVIDSALVHIKIDKETIGEGWKLNINSESKVLNQLTLQDSLGSITALLYPIGTEPIKLISDPGNLSDSNFKIFHNKNNTITIKLPGSINNKTETIGATPDEIPIATLLQKLQKRNNILLIIMVMSMLLTIGTVLYYSGAIMKLRQGLEKKIETLIQLQTNQEKEEIKTGSLLTPVAEPSNQYLNITEPENNSKEPITILPNDDSYFICEIMMTAGPRKKPMSDPDSDIDLGEDVCGFVSTTKEIFTWLLDGTSDDDSWKDPVTRKEYFSSRLLAQSIGNKLRSNFIANGYSSPETMIENAMEEVKQSWLQIIGELGAEEKQRLKSRIESKLSPQCSSTALIGHLKNDGTLSAGRTGDSQMFLYHGVTGELKCLITPLMGKSESGVDRIFFRLQLDSDQNFEIVSNKPVFDVTEEKNVHTIISFSDGIGPATETLLKEHYKNDPDKIKQDIIYQLQGTGDDKCICFIERR